MNVVFLTHDVKSGSGIMRAVWPAQWINKFTEHTARVYGQDEYMQLGFGDCITNADVIIMHRVVPQMLFVLEAIREHYSHIKIIYDTDDLEIDLFDTYYLSGLLGGNTDFAFKVFKFADSVICASESLRVALTDYIQDKPVTVIDNAFDMTLAHNNREKHKLPRYKIAWGGGSSHYRDLEMTFRLGHLQDLCRKYPIDVCFHSIIPNSPGGLAFNNPDGQKGVIHNMPPAQIDKYVDAIFNDADLVIVPLITHRLDYVTNKPIRDGLNDCRSRLKLIEAGMMRCPVVASDVKAYNGWEGRVRLVDNTYAAWYDAIEYYIQNQDKGKEDGEINYETVNKYYTAEITTKQRIKFFEERL